MKVERVDHTVPTGPIIDIPDGKHMAVRVAAVRASLGHIGQLPEEQCFFVEARTKGGGIITIPMTREMALGLADSIRAVERRAVADGILPEEH